jgi:site-specific DNA-methyltransferase (adenine-specific)
MAHCSEGSERLDLSIVSLSSLSHLKNIDRSVAAVYLFWLPFDRTNDDAINSKDSFAKVADFCSQINEESTVCILTTPPDAALLLSELENTLRFQSWVVVKTTPDAYPTKSGNLPRRHAALLVLTKYHKSLRHTKTRVQYTYCPFCKKTTKDYGGKKHTYHEYGTMLSDVWRDIECNPSNMISEIENRLRDLFGLSPYKILYSIDLRACVELLPNVEVVVSTPSLNETKENTPPYVNHLYPEDCLKALGTIPDNSIDFCFADPPYNVKKQYEKWNDALELVEYFAWCDKWLSELCRVLKPGRTLAVLNIPNWAVRHYQHLSSIMSFQSWIAWDALSFPVRMIMPAHYAVLCFSKGNPRPLPGLINPDPNFIEVEYLKTLEEFYCLRANCVSQRRRLSHDDRSSVNDLWSDIHRLKHNSRRVNHPCQLPPMLMRRLFALFTKPNEIILDCFNGSGTSTLVAEQMKRRYIGIEHSLQYHELAKMRHEQVRQNDDPFGKVDSIPSAKNSPVQRLPKQKYQVSKKVLQLDVKRITKELKLEDRLPTREEVEKYSEFPIKYFDEYFVSWGEVCAAARTTGMTEIPSSKSRDDTH